MNKLFNEETKARLRMRELPTELSALARSDEPMSEAMSAKVDALIADMRSASADIRRLLAE